MKSRVSHDGTGHGVVLRLQMHCLQREVPPLRIIPCWVNIQERISVGRTMPFAWFESLKQGWSIGRGGYYVESQGMLLRQLH